MNQNSYYELNSQGNPSRPAQSYIKINAFVLKALKHKIEQDGFILHHGKGIYVRYICAHRFNPSHQEVFSIPFIGYLKGQETYIREKFPSLLR